MKELSQVEPFDVFFRVVDHEGDRAYPIEVAQYGLFSYPYGYELIFHLLSEDSDEMNQSPHYEVSIFLTEMPVLSVGSSWQHQPGDIEGAHLGIMSNFYKFGHDYFDEFSVEVIGIDGDKLLCEIEGTVCDSHYKIKSRALFCAEGWERDEVSQKGEKLLPIFK